MKTETHRSSNHHPTKNLVGAFLREHRHQKGWSLTHTAQGTGIAKSTLSKWENGTVTPRLPELSRVLDALEVLPSDRAGLLQESGRGVSTPRASPPSSPSSRIRMLKTPPLSRGFPVHGDLLRAMRHRAALSQAEAARRAQIAQGTLAKWESGEDWPETGRLHALAFVLGASADEVAILTTGVQTYFPGLRNPLAENDLENIENEIAQLRRLSYEQRFAPYDLWFLSLLARLWSTSLREDGLGERAFRLWSQASYVYLIWLYNNCRDDTDDLSEFVIARMSRRAIVATDISLSIILAWISTTWVVDSVDHPLGHRKNYLQAKSLRPTVSARAIRVVRESTARLEVAARRKGALSDKALLAMQARARNDHLLSQLLAISKDREGALAWDSRAMSFWGKDSHPIDLLQWRAKLYYTVGDTVQAAELMARIPGYSTSASNDASLGASEASDDASETGVTHFQQVLQLEMMRSRARALLDRGTASARDEAYQLLTGFNRQIATSGFPARVQEYMGPLTFQPK